VQQEEQRAVIDARQSGAEAAFIAERITLVLDVLLLLLGASRQSKRRNTVSGRMTLRYSLRL
jgi:hypothetical protein